MAAGHPAFRLRRFGSTATNGVQQGTTGGRWRREGRTAGVYVTEKFVVSSAPLLLLLLLLDLELVLVSCEWRGGGGEGGGGVGRVRGGGTIWWLQEEKEGGTRG